jgi:hypothetical protein
VADVDPIHFLTTSQFWAGVAAGAVAAGIVVMLGRFGRKGAGVAFAAAALVALATAGEVAAHHRLPAALILGSCLAATCAALAHGLGGRLLAVALAATPGAIVAAGAVVGVPQWGRVLVVLFGAVGGALIADYETRAPSGMVPPLWLLTVAGVYWTVPDTEAARAVFGVAIAIALLGWPLASRRFATAGAVASTCVLGWTIAQGGIGRAGSIVGGVATLGVFALEPIVARLHGDTRKREPATGIVRIYEVVAHAACVAAASRFVGLATERNTAVLRLFMFAPLAYALTYGLFVVPAVLARRAQQ